MKIFLLAFAVAAGVLNTLQSGSNSMLNKQIHQPFATATIIYLGGLLVVLLGWLGAILIGKGQHLPTIAQVADVPWYGWLGGLLGLSFVLGTMLVAPKLGAGSYTAFSITAAVITSLVLDNFALMGFEQHQAGWGRIIGAVLIITGLGLIAKF